MRIFIADDESLVRISLIDMIKEMDDGWEIAGEASCGEELLEMLPTVLPDLALVDIRMPEINGLEAIRIGSNISPATKWIILSGASEFAYAREAIKLGAIDYLLKPASQDHLQTALSKAKAAHRKSSEWLNSKFEKEIVALQQGLSTTIQETSGTLYERLNYMSSVFYADSFLEPLQAAEIQRSIYDKIRGTMEEQLSHSVYLAQFIQPSGEITVVGAWDPLQGSEGMLQISGLLQKTEQDAMSFCSQSFSVTAIRTELSSGYSELHEQWAKMRRAAELRVVKGISRRWQFNELEACRHDAHCESLSRILLKAALAYKEKNYVGYMKAAEDFKKLCSDSAKDWNSAAIQAVRQFIYSSVQYQLSDQKANWPEELIQFGERILSKKISSECENDLVQRAISLVERKYGTDIAIAQIAKELHVSPNYLSTLFHKKTGSTLIKYLNNLRIIKAKELLADPNMQVQQVAEQVGYDGTRHFTKLFTETVGCNPSEFKKKIQSR